MKPDEGEKLVLKSEEDLLRILRSLNWNGNDENRIKMAKEYGGKEVTCDNPQDHHSYCFTKEGPSIHYSMISKIIPI